MKRLVLILIMFSFFSKGYTDYSKLAYDFKFNIRNKQGGLHPTHLMCDYKPNPAGASLK